MVRDLCDWIERFIDYYWYWYEENVFIDYIVFDKEKCMIYLQFNLLYYIKFGKINV